MRKYVLITPLSPVTQWQFFFSHGPEEASQKSLSSSKFTAWDYNISSRLLLLFLSPTDSPTVNSWTYFSLHVLAYIAISPHLKLGIKGHFVWLNLHDTIRIGKSIDRKQICCNHRMREVENGVVTYHVRQFSGMMKRFETREWWCLPTTVH